jgi:hypothetical protein
MGARAALRDEAMEEFPLAARRLSDRPG